MRHDAMQGGDRQVWLVVEDNEDDFFLFRRAAKCLTGRFEVHRVHDGFEATEVLSDGLGLPFLVLSDLKMPRMDGLDLLGWFRRQGRFREVPFVILSSSRAEQDIKAARELGADDYLVKPSNLDTLEEMVRNLMDERTQRLLATWTTDWQ